MSDNRRAFELYSCYRTT